MAVSHLWLSFLTEWTNKRGPFTSIISSSCSSQQKFSILAQSLALHFMLLNFILFSWLQFLRSSGSSSMVAWLLFPLRVLLQTSLGPSEHSLFCTEVNNKNWMGTGSRLTLEELQQQPRSCLGTSFLSAALSPPQDCCRNPQLVISHVMPCQWSTNCGCCASLNSCLTEKDVMLVECDHFWRFLLIFLPFAILLLHSSLSNGPFSRISEH